MSGADPTVPAAVAPNSIDGSAGSNSKSIAIPVANVWGSKDTDGAHRSMRLSTLCDARHRNIFIHDSGHEVPGTGSAVMGAVRVIRRAIDQASDLQ